MVGKTTVFPHLVSHSQDWWGGEGNERISLCKSLSISCNKTQGLIRMPFVVVGTLISCQRGINFEDCADACTPATENLTIRTEEISVVQQEYGHVA